MLPEFIAMRLDEASLATDDLGLEIGLEKPAQRFERRVVARIERLTLGEPPQGLRDEANFPALPPM